MLSIKEHHEAIEYASKFRVSELRQKNPGLDKSFDKDWHNDIYVKCLVAALKYDPARGPTMEKWLKMLHILSGEVLQKNLNCRVTGRPSITE
jgi:hypothetical protein